MSDSAYGGALSFVGGLIQNAENKDMFESGNAFSAEQAAINRAFQTEMSNTAHQREVRDLIAAGINPMLSARLGGASTPTGNSASSIAAPRMENVGAAAIQSAVQVAQKDNLQAQSRNLDADTRNKEAELAGKQGSGQLNDAQVANLRANTTLALANVDIAAQTKHKVIAEVNAILAQEKHLQADTALKQINEVLQKYDVPRMKAESAYFGTDIGRQSPHNKYGPQTPFRFLEGTAEKIYNKATGETK